MRARATRFVGLLAVVAVAAVFAGPSQGRHAKSPLDELDISTIQAIFTGCPSNGPFPPKPAFCATHYDVNVLHKPEGAALHYEWFIQLKLINKEGQPDPGTPGSGADFDPTCTNDELPGSKVVEGTAGQSGVVYHWQGLTDFIWYHGDVGVYSDHPQYGCDHSKMGPDGHQGIVTLIVDDANPGEKYTPWVCQANYYGTNTGLGAEEDTDCHPDSEEATERFLLAVAWNDEVTALHMLESKKNQSGAKSEIEHSIDDLKRAIAKEKTFPYPDPFWIGHVQRAIDLDETALKGDKSALHKAILAKGAMLDDGDDDYGWGPPPKPLPYPGH